MDSVEAKASRRGFVLAFIVFVLLVVLVWLMAGQLMAYYEQLQQEVRLMPVVTATPRPTPKPVPTTRIVINHGRPITWPIILEDVEISIGHSGPGGDPQPFFDHVQMNFEFGVSSGQVDPFYNSMER